MSTNLKTENGWIKIIPGINQIIDNLTSTRIDASLSAKQGKVLNDKIGTVESSLDSVESNLNDIGISNFTTSTELLTVSADSAAVSKTYTTLTDGMYMFSLSCGGNAWSYVTLNTNSINICALVSSGAILPRTLVNTFYIKKGVTVTLTAYYGSAFMKKLS